MFQGMLLVLLGLIPAFGSLGTTEVLPLEVAVAAQVGTVIVSLRSVTLPLRARSLPSMLAPFATVIELSAKTLPLKTAVVLIAAVSTRQKTLQAWAPLVRDTVLPDPIVSPDAAAFAWKMKTAEELPCPSRTSGPAPAVIPNAVEAES